MNIIISQFLVSVLSSLRDIASSTTNNLFLFSEFFIAVNWDQSAEYLSCPGRYIPGVFRLGAAHVPHDHGECIGIRVLIC